MRLRTLAWYFAEMKEHNSAFGQSFRGPLRLRRRDIAMTLIPFALWIALIQARPSFIQPTCAVHPTPCTKESVFAWDRTTLGLESPEADGYSYFTQNLSGAVAAGVPLAWTLGLAATGAMTWPVAMTVAGTNLVILTQTTAINGLFTEAAHHLFQRPRPFVYSDPYIRGQDPQNYTSFYSGHTSFAAAAGICLLLTLFSLGAPLRLIAVMGVLANLLISLTGLFRMIAGRHFLTDVVTGALAGTAVAAVVVLSHRSTGSRPA